MGRTSAGVNQDTLAMDEIAQVKFGILYQCHLIRCIILVLSYYFGFHIGITEFNFISDVNECALATRNCRVDDSGYKPWAYTTS